MADSKDWIVRYYASHDDIPEGKYDGHIVRELVYCKDCKWADWYTAGDGRTYCYCSETGKGGNEEDDFCSYGERKE